MEKKNTIVDLPALLKSKGDKRYNFMIHKCLFGAYHDYISAHATPKIFLCNDLLNYAELADILEAVMRGEYDEHIEDLPLDNEIVYVNRINMGAC